MLNPIDFLHDIDGEDSYLIDPKTIHQQISGFFDKENAQWTDDDFIRFSLLNRLIWCISILNTIEGYRQYSDTDIHTFFLAYSMFLDITGKFKRLNEVKTDLFHKTTKGLNFPEGVIIGDVDDYSFSCFMRALITAHTASTDKRNPFIAGDGQFILKSVDLQSASPSDEDLQEKPDAFYVHVLLLYKDKTNHIIFKIYVDELKKFLVAIFNNRDFNILEKEAK